MGKNVFRRDREGATGGIDALAFAAKAGVQALLALAAQNCGRSDWADWLRRRAELLADINDLTRDRPILGELWRKTGQGEDSSGGR